MAKNKDAIIIQIGTKPSGEAVQNFKAGLFNYFLKYTIPDCKQEEVVKQLIKEGLISN